MTATCAGSRGADRAAISCVCVWCLLSPPRPAGRAGPPVRWLPRASAEHGDTRTQPSQGRGLAPGWWWALVPVLVLWAVVEGIGEFPRVVLVVWEGMLRSTRALGSVAISWSFEVSRVSFESFEAVGVSDGRQLCLLDRCGLPECFESPALSWSDRP